MLKSIYTLFDASNWSLELTLNFSIPILIFIITDKMEL